MNPDFRNVLQGSATLLLMFWDFKEIFRSTMGHKSEHCLISIISLLLKKDPIFKKPQAETGSHPLVFNQQVRNHI